MIKKSISSLKGTTSFFIKKILNFLIQKNVKKLRVYLSSYSEKALYRRIKSKLKMFLGRTMDDSQNYNLKKIIVSIVSCFIFIHWNSCLYVNNTCRRSWTIERLKQGLVTITKLVIDCEVRLPVIPLDQVCRYCFEEE